jgi:hypothetical protein
LPAAVARFVLERLATLRFERFPLGVGMRRFPFVKARV